MNIITEEQFKDKKNSDTLVVFGCGSSINNLSEGCKMTLLSYDSIGFNWFVKSRIPTTFYMIREQGNIPKRRHKGERPEDLYSMLNESYKDSTLLVHDQSHHTPHGIEWHSEEHEGNLPHDAIVVKDIKLEGHKTGVKKWGSTDMFKKGLIHGQMSMNNVLHFSVQMGYDKVVFSGVDLHDSRYFWLGDKESRVTLKRKNKKYHHSHAKAGETLKVIKEMQSLYNQTMYVYNGDSLLSTIMKVYGR